MLGFKGWLQSCAGSTGPGSGSIAVTCQGWTVRDILRSAAGPARPLRDCGVACVRCNAPRLLQATNADLSSESELDTRNRGCKPLCSSLPRLALTFRSGAASPSAVRPAAHPDLCGGTADARAPDSAAGP